MIDDSASHSYELPAENAMVLAQEDSPVFLAAAWAIPASMWADEDKALDAFRKSAVAGDWGYLQALATFGKVDVAFDRMESPEAIDGLSATPDTFFRVHMRPILWDPRFIGVAHRMGLLGYWRQAAIWPDFCRDPDLIYNCQAEAAKYPLQPALTRLGNGD